MNYDIEFKPRAVKDLAALPKSAQRRILTKIEGLRHELAGDVKRRRSPKSNAIEARKMSREK